MQMSQQIVAHQGISEVAYADMTDGSWAIVIQSQENDFVTQREFNVTAGGSATAVVVTVSTPCLLATPVANVSRLHPP